MSIHTTSKLLYRLLLIPLSFIPALWGYFLFSIEEFAQVAKMNLSFAIQWNTVVAWQLYVTWLVTLIPATIVFWGLMNLRRAFYAFSENDVFNMTNVTLVKRFAFALILSAVLKTLMMSVVSVVLSANHPAGQKMLSLLFSSYDLVTIFVGLMFWLVAKILIQAHALSEENKQFI